MPEAMSGLCSAHQCTVTYEWDADAKRYFADCHWGHRLLQYPTAEALARAAGLYPLEAPAVAEPAPVEPATTDVGAGPEPEPPVDEALHVPTEAELADLGRPEEAANG